LILVIVVISKPTSGCCNPRLIKKTKLRFKYEEILEIYAGIARKKFKKSIDIRILTEYTVLTVYLKRINNMKITISNRSGVPIYEQIKEQIKEMIFSGELAEDELLPSIRGLAKLLRISVVTTTRAYADLEEEGFIVQMQGKGCYVLPRNKELAKENAFHKIEDGLLIAVKTAKSDNIAKEEVWERFNILWENEE
jgi:GntR family transcriptional regulator